MTRQPSDERLVAFFKEWQAALLRAEMAEQTLVGARNDATLKEARFKGAAELIYGSTYTFEYDEKKGLTFRATTAEHKLTNGRAER